MTEEIWRDIPRYHHCEVSNLGRVRYKDYFLYSYTGKGGRPDKIRPAKLTGFGYYQVNIVPEDRSTYGRNESIHNLVAEAFIGPRPAQGYEVDHIDEDKLNNSPDNLRWIHHGENVSRSPNIGRGQKRGRFAGKGIVLGDKI